MTLEELSLKAASLAGRVIDIEPTRSGDFVVLWFNRNDGPPPPGKTEAEALENFIAFMQSKENTDVN